MLFFVRDILAMNECSLLSKWGNTSMKVFGSGVHTSSYFVFPIVNGWVVMFLDFHRTVLTFRSWLDLICVVLAFLISILKSSNHFNTTDTRLQISIAQASNNIWKVLQVIIWALIQISWTIVIRIRFWRNLIRSIKSTTKEGHIWSEFNLVGLENSQTPSTSKVWPSDHREHDRSCAWPFYSLVQIFPKALYFD